MKFNHFTYSCANCAIITFERYFQFGIMAFKGEKTDKRYYGRCTEDHVHLIKREYEKIAMYKKENFEGNMFERKVFEEVMIPDRQRFIRLEPTNCPDISEYLQFNRGLNPRNNVSKAFIELLEPFDTLVELLKIFELLNPYHKKSPDEAKLKLYSLIGRWFPTLKSENLEKMSYETYRQMYLRKLWSKSYQERVFSKLTMSSYPSKPGETVDHYMRYWLKQFTCNTAYLTSEIIDELMKSIPSECRSVLEHSPIGGKLCDVYEAMQYNRHIFRMTYNPVFKPRPGFFGWLKTYYNNTVLSGVSIFNGLCEYDGHKYLKID